MSGAVGVDVGGTKCLGVLVADGVVVDECRRPTPRAGELVDVLVDMVSTLRGGTDVPVGVGVPGLVTGRGVIRWSPNLPDAVEFDVGAALSERLGVAVAVDNDATCALEAEADRGAAHGVAHAWLVTFGTGIGSAVLVDGVVPRGWQGFAGEVGHLCVERDGRRCPCGLSGCWERYASAASLVTALGGTEQVTADSPIVAEWAEWVAIGIATLVSATDPEVVVVGGGVLESAEVVLPAIRSRIGERLYAPRHRRIPEIRPAAFGVRAGAIGAALLARRSCTQG